MHFNRGMRIIALALFVGAAAFTVFAQEPEVAVYEDSMQNDNNPQWAWGEVTNLDSQAKTFTLKYLDYETDQEKELLLSVDEKTTYENIKGFDQIKTKDTLSVDYVSGPDDDKYTAKNISFEDPNALPPAASMQSDTGQMQ